MGVEWTFRTRSWARPGYTALEGAVSDGSQSAEFFLVVGSNHISVDVQSLRGFADRFLDLLATILGKPESGPAVVNIGELMDSLDEIPMNATWSFPPARREEILNALERQLHAGSTGPSHSAGESGR